MMPKKSLKQCKMFTKYLKNWLILPKKYYRCIHAHYFLLFVLSFYGPTPASQGN